MKRNETFDGFNRTHTYQDGTIRIVTNEKLKVGDMVPVFEIMNQPHFEPVSKIVEAHPSKGDFEGLHIPNSYRVDTIKTRSKEQAKFHQTEMTKIAQLP